MEIRLLAIIGLCVVGRYSATATVPAVAAPLQTDTEADPGAAASNWKVEKEEKLALAKEEDGKEAKKLEVNLTERAAAAATAKQERQHAMKARKERHERAEQKRSAEEARKQERAGKSKGSEVAGQEQKKARRKKIAQELLNQATAEGEKAAMERRLKKARRHMHMHEVQQEHDALHGIDGQAEMAVRAAMVKSEAEIQELNETRELMRNISMEDVIMMLAHSAKNTEFLANVTLHFHNMTLNIGRLLRKSGLIMDGLRNDTRNASGAETLKLIHHGFDDWFFLIKGFQVDVNARWRQVLDGLPMTLAQAASPVAERLAPTLDPLRTVRASLKNMTESEACSQIPVLMSNFGTFHNSLFEANSALDASAQSYGSLMNSTRLSIQVRSYMKNYLKLGFMVNMALNEVSHNVATAYGKLMTEKLSCMTHSGVKHGKALSMLALAGAIIAMLAA